MSIDVGSRATMFLAIALAHHHRNGRLSAELVADIEHFFAGTATRRIPGQWENPLDGVRVPSPAPPPLDALTAQPSGLREPKAGEAVGEAHPAKQAAAYVTLVCAVCGFDEPDNTGMSAVCPRCATAGNWVRLTVQGGGSR